MTRRELKLAAVAGSALILVVVFLAWSLSTKEDEVPVGDDLCPINPSLWTEYTIILLDVSEPLIGGNADELKRRILEIGGGLQRYGNLTVFDLHDLNRPIASICRPQNRQECDPKTAPRACRGVQEAYERDFADPIAGKVEHFLAQQIERDTSPIMEAIKDVSTLTAFRQMSPGNKSLYIVSDMLQHTKGVYSHYKHRTVQAREFATISDHPFYLNHRPDLEGTDIEILYILRRKNRNRQTNHHKAFWHDYFRDADSRHVQLTEINFVTGDSSDPEIDYPPVINSERITEVAPSLPVPKERPALANRAETSASPPAEPKTEQAVQTEPPSSPPKPERTAVAERLPEDHSTGTQDPDDGSAEPASGDSSSPPIDKIAEIYPRPGTTFTDSLESGADGPEMVVIPAGRFRMGCRTGHNCNANETPAHEATIPIPFAMSKYEVTVADFGRFIESSGYRTLAESEVAMGCRVLQLGRKRTEWKWIRQRHWRKPGYQVAPTHPVACVSWSDAMAYVQWLASATGSPYRLPTETEWEYAARAGSEASFHFGNNINLLCQYGNIVDTTPLPDESSWSKYANCSDGVAYAAPVGSYTANSFRLHDMHGNLAEWVEDCWHPGYAGTAADSSARLTSNCEKRVVRGGFWGSPLSTVRSAARAAMATEYRSAGFGFRIARSLEPQSVTLGNEPISGSVRQSYCTGTLQAEDDDCLVTLAGAQQ